MATAKAVTKNQVVKANKAALDCFPSGQIREALAHLGEAKGAKDKAQTDGDNYSLDVSRLAEAYRAQCAEVTEDHALIMSDWRENMALTLEVMAAEKSPLVIITPATDDKPAKAKWNGTANNAISIAKGVCDFDISIDTDCLNDDGEVSYREVKRTVEAKRADRWNEAHPEEHALNVAKENVRESFKALTETVFGTSDIQLIEFLNEQLIEMNSDAVAELEKQAEIEAMAVEETAVETTENDEAIAA